MKDKKYSVRMFDHALAPLNGHNPSHPGKIEKCDSFEEAKEVLQKYKDKYDHVDIQDDHDEILLEYLNGKEVKS